MEGLALFAVGMMKLRRKTTGSGVKRLLKCEGFKIMPQLHKK
jgi:hypothetical protein